MTECPSVQFPLNVSRPHVVILGAGASRAAAKAPLMKDLVEQLGLEGLFRRAGVGPDMHADFEGAYSQIVQSSSDAAIACEIEARVDAYFAALRLPAEPTLYDHLLLSLRAKDLIATFNWDPYLWQALRRVHCHAPVPHVRFLHGTVATGYCAAHRPTVIGPRGGICRRCNKPYRNTPLLFPVAHKDYASNPAISGAWSDLSNAMKHASVLTVFGFSAPRTDAEAVRLLEGAWGPTNVRRYEETELVNIAPEDAVIKSFQPFIYSHHYGYFSNIYETMLARFPRRSCEAYIAQNFDCEHLEMRPFPKRLSWSDLLRWLEPVLAQEQQA